MRESSGFTLMELVVVCMLIAFFLSLSIPTLRNSLVTDQLESTARKIIGMVKELRNQAVRDNKAYFLHIELDEKRIWYEADAATTTLERKKEEKGIEFPEDITLEDVTTHSQGAKATGTVTIWISKRGYMDQTAMHLSEGGDNRLTLFFSPFSGAAKVYDGFVDFEE